MHDYNAIKRRYVKITKLLQNDYDYEDFRLSILADNTRNKLVNSKLPTDINKITSDG